MELFAVFNEEKGYLCEDEDVVGLNYSHEIDEATLLFIKENEAQFNAEKDDKVIPVTIDESRKNEYLII